MSVPEFEAADLARQVEALDAETVDRLPYGVVKLDARGVVQLYSFTEAQLSGRKKRPTVGLDFWREVAPCMAGPDMRGRVEAAAAAGTVDIEMGWIGDFDDPRGEIRIRVMSAAGGGLWLFMNREPD
jgi:photoactive yellow protein